MTFSLRCLLDRHDWTTDSLVVRGQTWTDGRSRCRRCAMPKPDSSRRVFLMGASALTVVAAAGPLEIVTAARGFAGMEGVLKFDSITESLASITRRAYGPILASFYSATPTYAGMLRNPAPPFWEKKSA